MGEELHVKSLFQGLNVDMAQAGLKPSTFGCQYQVSINGPRRPQKYQHNYLRSLLAMARGVERHVHVHQATGIILRR